MITINTISAPCGSGKTLWAFNQMATGNSIYIFASDKINTLLHQKESFCASYPDIPVVEIHSNTEDKLSVSHQLYLFEKKYNGHDHVVIFMTHSGILECDFSLIQKYDPVLIIDEVPQTFSYGTLNINASWKAWENNFGLKPLEGTKWATLRAKKSDIKPNFGDDNAFAFLSHYFRKMKNHPVFVDTQDWSEFKNGDKTTLQLWVSVSYENLSAFSSIYVMGDCIEDSLFKKVLGKDNRIVFNSIQPFVPIQIPTKDVTIHYFSERMLTQFYITSPHKPLEKVEHYIDNNVKPGSFIWAKNHETKLSLSGKQIDPKSFGLNNYMEYNSAVMMFAAKPSPHEIAFMRHVYDTTALDILTDRELSPLYQMVMRTSLRDPVSTEKVNIYVFDSLQAEYLRNKIPGSVTKYVDIGITGQDEGKSVDDYSMTVTERVQTQKKKHNEVSREYMRKKREQERQMKIANGTYKKPGRPRKDSV